MTYGAPNDTRPPSVARAENAASNAAVRSARWESSVCAKTSTCMGDSDVTNVIASSTEAYIHVKDGFFDDAGNIAHPETRKFLHGWMDKYAMWVKKFTG